MRHRERGAAMIETVLALPVMLLVFFAVSWSVRVGAVSERAESSIRYAGVISAQQDAFHDYSLFTLYNNLGPTSAVQTATCQGPTSVFTSGGALPVVPNSNVKRAVIPAFWLPDSGSVQSYCLTSSGRQTFNGLTRSYLLLQNAPVMNATVSESVLFGARTGTTISTSTKFYRSADLSTIMHCVPVLDAAISASLDPAQYTHGGPVRPLLSGDFPRAPLAVTQQCANAGGAPSPAPTPPPYSPAPGKTPTQTPGPGGSPSPRPSPNPSKPPASPTPAGSPTPRASASPSPMPTTKPTGAPTSKPTGNPTAKPTGTPTGRPTAKPTGVPTSKPTGSPTPKPSASPTPRPTSTPTPKPTASPTAKPTHLPTPTPAPSGTPGNIF